LRHNNSMVVSALDGHAAVLSSKSKSAVDALRMARMSTVFAPWKVCIPAQDDPDIRTAAINLWGTTANRKLGVYTDFGTDGYWIYSAPRPLWVPRWLKEKTITPVFSDPTSTLSVADTCGTGNYAHADFRLYNNQIGRYLTYCIPNKNTSFIEVPITVQDTCTHGVFIPITLHQNAGRPNVTLKISEDGLATNIVTSASYKTGDTLGICQLRFRASRPGATIRIRMDSTTTNQFIGFMALLFD